MNTSDTTTTASAKHVMLRATDHRESFAQNTHRVILRNETDTDFFAWPDPTWTGNSDQWKPSIDKPLQYPKFAWEIAA